MDILQEKQDTFSVIQTGLNNVPLPYRALKTFALLHYVNFFGPRFKTLGEVIEAQKMFVGNYSDSMISTHILIQ